MEDFSAKSSKLSLLKNIIEKMNKQNQIEILRILHENEVTLNENKNGIYVNLTELSDEIMDKITQYVEYINSQETKLNTDETYKQSYMNNFFQNKDIM